MHPDEDGFTQDIVSVLRQQWQGKPDNPFQRYKSNLRFL